MLCSSCSFKTGARTACAAERFSCTFADHRGNSTASSCYTQYEQPETMLLVSGAASSELERKL